MALCSECQPKVEVLERALHRAIDGVTKDVEWNRCAFPLPDARRVIWSYKDYCRRHHGAEVNIFTSQSLPVSELRDAVVLWMWERHGIDVESKDVSFNYRADNNQFLGVVVGCSPQGDADVPRAASGRLVPGENEKKA